MAAREKGGPEKGAGDGAKRRGCDGLGRGVAAEMPDGRRAGVPVGQAGAREGAIVAPLLRPNCKRRVEEMKRDASVFYLSDIWDAGPAGGGTGCHRRDEEGQGVERKRMAAGRKNRGV